MARSATWPADPHDQGKPIIEALLALTVLSIIVLALRFYLRIKNGATPAAHDWAMFIAVLFQIVNQACIVQAYRWGLGAHDINLMYDSEGKFIPSMPWTNILKWQYISVVPGVLTSITARISVTLLLITLFGTKRWLKWFLTVATICVAIVGSVSVIITWVQVSPVEGLWNPLLPARRWSPNIQTYVVYVSGSIFAFTDFSFMLFPIIIIWKLNMPSGRRIGLCILMAGSIFCLVACIMRIVTDAHQSLYTSAYGILWAGLEQCLVIILGSAPPLAAIRKLDFVDWISKSLSSASGSLFTSLKTRQKMSNGAIGENCTEKSSGEIIKPSGSHKRASSDRTIEATTTIYQSSSIGTYKADVLPAGV
ncbi:hypothetical protein HYFRA_00010118 [Hymenoscyphus fraxineus]|uniref:Rhodopsin domain-containing protein n=1 Tax=Hymenoscyphus fraxineus TaxID=746836 RepID=A0A9N9KUZ4_9HELO|nr:hypothetical protein HYFRA_00010118 [Hymenoscyphus fraxineus]